MKYRYVTNLFNLRNKVFGLGYIPPLLHREMQWGGGDKKGDTQGKGRTANSREVSFLSATLVALLQK